MSPKDLIVKLDRASMLKLLTQVDALPSFRCTNQLRFALTQAWRSGKVTDAMIIEEHER